MSSRAVALVGEHAVDRLGERRVVGRVRPATRRRRRPRESNRRARRRRARRRSSLRAAGSRSLRRSTGTRAPTPRRAARGGRRRRRGRRARRARARRSAAARSRRRSPAGPGRRGRRSRGGDRDGARRARRTRRRGAAGSCAARACRSRARRVRRRPPPPRRAACAPRRRATGAPSGITTSRPALRSPGPKISSISSATNSEPVCTVAPARDRPPDERHQRPHFRRAQLGIAHERAVVDAHERREPARWREIVRRVDHGRGPQPAVDARDVGAGPDLQQDPCRPRHEARLGRARRRAACARAAQCVRNEPGRGFERPTARRRSRRPRCRCRCARRAAV